VLGLQFSAEVVRAALAFLLLSACIAKIKTGPSRFADAVAKYDVIPKALVRPASFSLLAVECALGSLLLWNVRPQLALLASAALFLSFVVIAALAVSRNESGIECGCLGSLLPLRLGRAAVTLNSVVAVAAVVTSFALGGNGVLVVFPSSDGSQAFSMQVVWALAILLAAAYWLSAYAFSVLRFVEDQLHREEWAE
jgi:hypothetical protein